MFYRESVLKIIRNLKDDQQYYSKIKNYDVSRIYGTIFKNKIFCRDLFKNQNILQELFFQKMGSVIMCDVSKSSQK